ARHFLPVFVGAGEKKDILAHQAVRTGDGVGHEGRVRVTEMRLRVDVVDRCADVKAAHGCVAGVVCCAPYACTAIACTSLTDRFLAFAIARQSSNSGTALITRPACQASLKRIGPTAVSTRTISRCSTSRSTS